MFELLRYTLLLILLTFSLPGHFCAQEGLPIASKNIQVTGFDTAQLNSYRADPDYQYARKAVKQSLLARIWQAVMRYLREMFSEGASASNKLLRILIIGGAVVILIFFFMRSQFQSVFARGNKSQSGTVSILNTNVKASSLSEKIEQAILSGDYRTAFRWTYIDLLRQLGLAQLIRLHPQKANRDYRREMHASLYQEDFSSLADTFDYTWYGEYPIDKPTFERNQRMANGIIHEITKS